MTRLDTAERARLWRLLRTFGACAPDTCAALSPENGATYAGLIRHVDGHLLRYAAQAVVRAMDTLTAVGVRGWMTHARALGHLAWSEERMVTRLRRALTALPVRRLLDAWDAAGNPTAGAAGEVMNEVEAHGTTEAYRREAQAHEAAV